MTPTEIISKILHAGIANSAAVERWERAGERRLGEVVEPGVNVAGGKSRDDGSHKLAEVVMRYMPESQRLTHLPGSSLKNVT